MSLEMVKKYKVGLWIDKNTAGPEDWVRVEKSTSFDYALNPTTSQRDYITDQNPTTEVDGYTPALNQAVTMFKGNPDYELLFPVAYGLKTGDEVKHNVLVVFMQEPVKSFEYSAAAVETGESISAGTYYERTGAGTAESPYVYTITRDETFQEEKTYYTRSETVVGYLAHKSRATLSFTNINAVDSTITFDINFGGRIQKGYAAPDPTTHKPVFIQNEDDGDNWIDPFAE